MQRSKSNEFFRSINKAIPHFLVYSRGYIRFWNYESVQKEIDDIDIKSLIESTKEEVNNFCSSLETIYLSCGIPTRFKIAFSSANNFSNNTMSQLKYPKISIKNSDDFHKEHIKEIIVEKEKEFKIFDGGNFIKLSRIGAAQSKNIVREINTLLTGYKLPFFCYDFSESGKNLKLSEFI